MKEFSWRVFSVTGNIDSYLLFKEMEESDSVPHEDDEEKSQEFQPPIH
ncbi:YqzL family protein [Alteribacter populi]|nr:YqzL family protein [Alteribacter populi]